MPGTAPRSVDRSASRLTRLVMVVAASVIALSGIIVVPTITAPPAAAAVIGDDYPAYLKAANQDALTDPWKFFNRECTSFVAWRLNEVNGIPFSNFFGGQRWGNANTWGQAAAKLGYRIDKTPAVGSIAWSTVGTYGHVAWVSNVMADGRVVIEEYNWRLLSTDERGRYRTRIVAASAFTGYIHVKDLNTWPPSEGTFIRVNDTGEIYRIAGGAAIYVSSWAAFGGEQRVQAVSAAQLASLPQVPRDGTILGNAASSAIYKVALGAPTFVSTWAAIGGQRASIGVDPAAISNAGEPGVWNHLRATPSDGFLQGTVSHRIFRVVSGRPYYVSSWEPYGAERNFVPIDDASINACDHMNCTPWGNLDSTSGSNASISVSGWAQDPNTLEDLTIRVEVDGVPFGTTTTDRDRPDVEAVFHRGNRTGYGYAAPASSGSHVVCVYGVNLGAGAGDTELGCRTVVVAPLGTLSSAAIPLISGPLSVGGVLTTGTSSWSPSPVALTYQWIRNGAAVSGATAVSYSVTTADLGASLAVTVSGTKAGFTTVAKTSLPVTVPAAAVVRLAGVDRFVASAAISARNYAPGSGVAYVASGLSFPDALSGAPVAAKNGGPVLLVTADHVPTAIHDELVRLRPTKIVVLGGPVAVSDAVKVRLGAYTTGGVSRLSGDDRFAASSSMSAAGFPSGASTVYVASGLNFPDALSGVPVAVKAGSPILLVSADEIPESIAMELRRLHPTRIVVLGGESSVSKAVFAQLSSFVATGNVSRLAGADRFAGSAEMSVATFTASAPVVYIANGLDFPDALSGAPVAGKSGAPILLVAKGVIPSSIDAELRRLKPTRIVVLGGEESVSAALEKQLAGYIR